MSHIDGGNANSTFDPVHVPWVNIVKDVQKYLQNDPNVAALVVPPYIGSDVAWPNGWIFANKLLTVQENTQRCAIVVSYAGGWTVPLGDSTASFPSVLVDIWADPTRNPNKSVRSFDAEEKCFRIHAAVKSALHLSAHRPKTGAGSIRFGDTRVVSSELLTEPDLQPIQNAEGAYMLRSRYGITTF